ncbi:hypothetical protein ACF09K_01800 [Streptomyces sp. NPDC014882]|uniref:hypothetical protein n=1 Tax=Streptomyces sp. NPDC014882 TaxID=3364927 RepID=UPI003701451B
MITALAVVVLSVSATLLVLLMLLLKRRGKTASDTADKLIGSLPSPLSAFFTRVGRLLIGLSMLRRTATPGRRENRTGARMRLIGALLPKGDEWRLEEMMEHRNTLRQQIGRVPRFHHLRLLLGVCTIRWETWRDPKRRID